ncbi:MAG: hypothetical protein ACRDK4_05000 [Solirubrobacteraceae bacterium]
MAEFRYIGLSALVAKGRAAVAAGVTDCAEDLVGKSQDATPVETGTLKASIHTSDLEWRGNIALMRVQTGGESSLYAIYIHEGHRKDGTHIIAAYPDGAKYIEGPLLDERPVYLERLARSGRSEF